MSIGKTLPTFYTRAGSSSNSTACVTITGSPNRASTSETSCEFAFKFVLPERLSFTYPSKPFTPFFYGGQNTRSYIVDGGESNPHFLVPSNVL